MKTKGLKGLNKLIYRFKHRATFLRQPIMWLKSAYRKQKTKGLKGLNKLIYRFKHRATFLRQPIMWLKSAYRKHQLPIRIGAGALALLIVFSLVSDVLGSKSTSDKYDISKVESTILSEPIDLYAEKLVIDQQTGDLVFNQGYTPGSDVAGQSNVPKITANFGGAPDNKVTITDPVNQVGLTFKPKFKVGVPVKNKNRVIYPVTSKNASKVYTLQASGFKEDIIIHDYSGDELSFAYDLELPDGLEARLEPDGSLGIYGVESMLLGSVSTGSDSDAELLKKARDNSEKAQLIFTLPAPFLIEQGKKTVENAKAWFGLEKNVLTVYASGLKDANYPLSLDPSVYVETATKLMRGNNESNIDFDVTNELIQKGKTTGGRFDSWVSTMELPSARWNHATAVAGGYIYVVGGNSGSAAVNTVYWAKFNQTTGAVEATNPGAGACANWCNQSVYDLPFARDASSMVAYNGFLYLFGGRDSAGARSNDVFIAKIGVNGEPSLWHPTDSNQANWAYWHQSTDLSSERSYLSAAAYNNRMYILGGQTNASAGGVTTVEVADIAPTGVLSAWSTTGMVVLPSARHSHTVQIYNDRVYLIGGNSNGTLQATTHYIKLTTSGTMQGSWTASTSFTTARMSWGGTFSVLWGGYIYIGGGCTEINASGYCTTIAVDTQIASINADGTLTDWSSISVTSSRIGYGMVVWRNAIYAIGGCTAHNTSTGVCTTTVTTTQYGTILTDGEASTVRNSNNPGFGQCSSAIKYRVHVFNSSGTFTVSKAGNVEYLVVGGGGGGGAEGGGGGGAGGFRTGTVSVTVGNKTVVVGGGGAIGASGSASSVLGIESAGGGRGGSGGNAATAGGSGGGEKRDGTGTNFGAGNTPSVSPSQGNAGGGSGGPFTFRAAAGGGGAGAVGGNGGNAGPMDTPSAEFAGSGGAGTASSITGVSVTYAGGGGGGLNSNSIVGNRGLGGAGGGGAGAYPGVNATAGGANTGGGGGGGRGSGTAGAGGSGIVIIRYQITDVEASGGTVTDIAAGGANYRVHTFNSSGTFTVTNAGNVEYLVVAGGGSGGARSANNAGGGGGGAGGLLTGNVSMTSGTKTVTVGNGGMAVGGGVGNNGANSVLDTITAIGGGGGGGYKQNNAKAGGSGGGAGRDAGTINGAAGTAGTPRQGYDGGGSASDRGAGGGGGSGQAGAIGDTGNSRKGGKGGDGISLAISGTSVTYAGGGGGGGGISYTDGTDAIGLGGAGGGGNGGWEKGGGQAGTGAGTAGAVNTGGGGGGGTAGAGGSGIVIIRYQITDVEATGGTVTDITVGTNDPVNCNMPPLGNGNGEGGQLAGGTVVNNGYIYYIGGCFSVDNNSVCFSGSTGKASDTISFSAIASDGSLVRSATCGGTYFGNWCVDNTNTINGSAGLAGFGLTVFNNVLYVVGGTDGSTWQSNVWRNPLNANGTLGTWSTQTFANLDLGAYKGYPYVFTRANPGSASTYPGNLYVIGGCGGLTSADNGLDCNGTFYTTVYKCNITTSGALEEADANDCTTTGQTQLDSEPGTGGSQGLGVMSGTVYANYIYLVGGQSPNESERGQVMYAKIDNSNNIVDADGETVVDNIWETSPNDIDPVRRRSAAFSYNGYLYALAGHNSAGGASLNDLLFAKINVSDGSIGVFAESTVTVNARWDLSAVVNNGYVYTMGGCNNGTPPANCTSTTAVIQTFQLYNNYSGSPASYSAGANLFATDRIGVSAAVLNGYIYVAGGCISATDCTDATNNVQYASLSSVGAIGSWANTTHVLPADRAWGQLEVAGGSLYYLGGQADIATDESAAVYYASSFSSGNINAAWLTASGAIGDTAAAAAVARTKFGATVWNDRIYVVGGLNSSGVPTNTVYISPQLSSGGDIPIDSWVLAANSVNVARSGNIVVAYANNLYSFAGYDGTNYLNDAQYTQINTDGTIDSWNYTTSLPTRIAQGDGFASNGFMYIFGGRSADTTCASNTIVAPISANTTTASGNNPTGVGEWFETSVKYNGDRYGNAAVYNEGKVYILGGGCPPPTTVQTVQNGLAGKFFNGNWRPTIANGNIGTLPLTTTNDSSNVTGTTGLPSAGHRYGVNLWPSIAYGNGLGDSYGFIAIGYFTPPTTGTYTIYTSSDDGSGVWIGDLALPGATRTSGNATLNNNLGGGQGNTKRSATTSLTGGVRYPIRIVMEEGGGGDNLTFSWSGPGISETTDLLTYFSTPITEAGQLTGNYFMESPPGATVTYTGANRVIQSTLQSQPQIAKYSYYVDTETDVFPTAFLLNGLDNNIGARWQYAYRSAIEDKGQSSLEGVKTIQLTNFQDNNQNFREIDIFDENNSELNYSVSDGGNMTYYSGTSLPRINDGNISTSGDNDYQVHPTNAVGKTITMTFATPEDVSRALFYNRTGCCRERIGGAKMVFRDSSDNVLYTYTFPTGVNPAEVDIDTTSGLSYDGWGQETVFGDVTLGSLESYVPRDTSGADTNFARYYYVTISIDASQTFGYPEDVSRGPTITDTTLFFTADPSKRLRHGKTFIQGVEQPLETPQRALFGGTVTDITQGGINYRVHTFTTSGNFVVNQPVIVEYLIVGGGGGAGTNGGGGGGAGGVLAGTFSPLAAGTYAVTVGAGGEGATYSPTLDRGDNGQNSVFNGLTAIGGGGGASRDVSPPAGNPGSGGSGGGGGGSYTGGNTRIGAAGTAGQGNKGGDGFESGGNSAGAGGGGYSSAGTNGSSLLGGNGGNGYFSTISGTNIGYAGGGAGGGVSGFNGTSGTVQAGAGGGGIGSRNGRVNSGGGGGAWPHNAPAGGNGGSGIVIIRYQR